MRRPLLAGLVAGAAFAVPAFPASASDCCKPLAAPVAPAADVVVLPPTKLVDQRGTPITLPDGRPWVLTFFYGHCPDVCPTLIYNVQDVAAAIPPAQRAKVAFGAITFDTARDTVPKLAEYAENFELRKPNEYLLTGEPAAITATLELFKFDFKPDRNGGYQHTTLTAVMDGQGRVLHHFYGLQPDIPRIAEVTAALVRP